MKKTVYAVCTTLVIASSLALADSAIRVKCSDADAGATITLNGKAVGNCPVDAFVPAGSVLLKARKVDGDYERVFEKSLEVSEGAPQRVDVILSAPRLTAEGLHRQQVATADAQRAAATAGDVNAMKKMVEFYEQGIGVEKDPAKANEWRQKIAAAAAQQEVADAAADTKKAQGGDIDAMDRMAKRYDTGTGVSQDTAQADAWREKAKLARQQQLVQQKAAAKQAKLEAVNYTEYTDKMANSVKCGDNIICILTTGIPFSLSGVVTDLVSSPFKTSKTIQLKNEAALRPSTWGNPDSLIARVQVPALGQ